MQAENKGDQLYKKRQGTSGVRGHLYETKLLSLFFFRAQHNDSIEQFYLGTNIDGIGAFDDICFKIEIKGHSRPVAAFLQAKHRENDNKIMSLDNKNNLAKYFESFLQIKQNFDIKSDDTFFNGTYEDTDCVFILYTTEQGYFNGIFDDNFADILNNLIATSNFGLRPLYTNEDVEFLCKIALKEDMKMLAKRFCKYIYQKNNDMNDKLILRYHVILSQKVINVSDIQPKGYRIATFRHDFFTREEADNFLLFRDYFLREMLKRHAVKKCKVMSDEATIHNLLLSFFDDPSVLKLVDLITMNIITYKNDRLEFRIKLPYSSYYNLRKLNLPQCIIDEAIVMSVKSMLIKPFNFQVPLAFGNKDLNVKTEERLTYLIDKLLGMLNKSSPRNIIILNETNTDAGFLRLNGGLGSAVGNVLVYDKETKLYKFNENIEWLERNSKSLLEQLTKQISNLKEYRLDVRVKDFPKLTFDDGYKKDLVKEFFSKLVFFANQADESGVGDILSQEIDKYEGADTKNFRVKSDAIFLNFHEEIQKWWMKQNTAEYLTKTSDLYQKAKHNIIDNPMINVMNMMYMSEIRNFECVFTENPRISLKSVDLCSNNIIVTDITKLTFIKLIQCLKIKDYVVLDLQYLTNLPTSDFRALTMELKNINEEKSIIIVCDRLHNTISLQRNIQNIVQAVKEKSVIAIINKLYLDMIMKVLPLAKLINDKGNSLSDLNKDSRTKVMKNANVIFQGQEVSLADLIDDVSATFIKGAVLSKILLNEKISLGDSLEFPNRPIELLSYDPTRLEYEIKELYIDRRVSSLTKAKCSNKILQTLHDITDDIVLITAKPGMGKSTLLSYLSIKTKKDDATLWLARINLLDYCKEFNKWKRNKVRIDTLEVIQFVCQIILNNKLKKRNNTTITLAVDNGEIYLKEPIDDEWITFELEMFLHCLNKSNLIFLFDGFDEICPNYEDEVISFLNAIRCYPYKQKMWITSRPYNRIKTVLKQHFGISDPYELEPFSETDQKIYFEKFWKYNLLLSELNEIQLQNVKNFISFMIESRDRIYSENFSRQNKPQNFLLNNVYYHFMLYIEHQRRILPMDFPMAWTTNSPLDFTIRLIIHAQNRFRQGVGEKGINDMLEFVGTPLHLYLVANYFLTSLKDDTQKAKQWDIDINTYAIYEKFLESKLKNIRFEDKNKMDIDNPDVLETYEIVRKDFIDMHKKLAAYAIFQNNGLKIFNKEGLEEIASMMKKIENGREKTGLIYTVSNNIPQFIHMTFTEYFAVEYISDLLKNVKSKDKQQEMCDFILNTMLFKSPNNVLNIMDQKLKIDTEFEIVIQSNSDYIFDVLMKQGTKSILCEVISKNLSNFLSIFVSILECNINVNNLDAFINVIVKSGFLRIAAALRYEDLSLNLLKLVRNIDISKWREILSDPYNYCGNIITNNEFRIAIRQHISSFFVRDELQRIDFYVPNYVEA